MCDIRIASEQARSAENFVKLGLIPGDRGAWLLQRIIGPSRAAGMSFIGEPIDARLAAEWGLVSRVVSHDERMAAAQGAAHLSGHSP